MEENKLYEAVRLINDHSDIDNELVAAAENLQNLFRRKYIKKLYSAVNESRNNAESCPSREVILLRALKGYAGEASCRQIDSIISTLNFFSTMDNINRSLNKVNNGSVKALSSDDGENISSRSVNITKALMMMALMGKL